MVPDTLPKVYHYVFAPLVNARVSDEVLDYGGFRVQSMRNEAFHNIAQWMLESSPNPGDIALMEFDYDNEAAFIVKPLQVEVAQTLLDSDGNTKTFRLEFTPTRHDPFRKERMCFNLAFHGSVSTPVALCSDDFPTARSVQWFWDSGTPEGRFSSSEEHVLQESQVGLIQRLMGFQIGEWLDGREWLSRSLLEYESGCRFGREPKDRLRDYFSALEALYTVEKEGIAQNLATRIAMVLADSHEGFGKVLDRIKKFYNACSSQRHGSKAPDLQEEDLFVLRACVRRGILMAFELSRSANGPGDWQTTCKALLNPRDEKLLLKLRDIRAGWNAIW